MTTLTRDRKDNITDEFHMITLIVSGPEGAVSTLAIWPGGSTGVSWCTATEKPGYELSGDCDVRGGQCWGDVFVSDVTRRVRDAWTAGGDDAVYEVLEELYRAEFGGGA